MHFKITTPWMRCAMDRGRAGLVLAVLMATIALLCPTPSPADNAGLWDRAVDLLNRQCWVPGNVVTHEVTRDLKDEPVEETRMVVSLSPDGRRVRRRLISAEKDGKDMTRKLRKEVEGTIPLAELAGELFPTLEANGKMTSRPNGEQRNIDGRRCAGFAFDFTEEEMHFEGTAWIDQKTGLPVEIHGQLTSLPVKQEDVVITAYAQSEYYNVNDQGRCLLERSQARTAIEIPGMRFKGTVITSRVCTAHWLAVTPL